LRQRKIGNDRRDELFQMVGLLLHRADDVADRVREVGKSPRSAIRPHSVSKAFFFCGVMIPASAAPGATSPH